MSKDANNISSYERAFNYYYDALNRDTAAIYNERPTAATTAFTVTHGWDENRITYDQNGNLLTLFRMESSQGAGNHVPIDNLTYTYDTTNPNQLKTVTDGTGGSYNTAGFMIYPGGSATGNYTYDANGNIMFDPYKNLTFGNYNVLNRTDKITVSTGNYTDYTYDAGANLIRKRQYVSGTLTTTTDYIDGFVYVNSVVSYFPMPEGRVVNNSGTFVQEFVITDQQGNARVSFWNAGANNVIVRQENSYYAFGLIMPGSTVSTPNIANKQLYNGGSEWQNDFSNLPDYYQTFNRNYDAATARFVGVDPQAESAESMTSYQYSGNNPIMMNDPMGDLPPNRRPPRRLPFLWNSTGDTQSAYDYMHGDAAENADNPFYLFSPGVQSMIINAVDQASTSESDVVVFDQKNDEGVLGYIAESVEWYNDQHTPTADIIYGYSTGFNPVKHTVYTFVPLNNDSDIDWGGATNAFIGMVGGIAEVSVGVLASETGIGVVAIGDGGMRAILNAGRLAAYFSGDKKSGDVMPTNFGAVIGKAVDNGNGVDATQVGNLQKLFGGANDLATFLMTGGNASAWAAVLGGSAMEGAAGGVSIISNYYSVYSNATSGK